MHKGSQDLDVATIVSHGTSLAIAAPSPACLLKAFVLTTSHASSSLFQLQEKLLSSCLTALTSPSIINHISNAILMEIDLHQPQPFRE
uniref:Uncharacterized protein n=1 Tax=Musa acuminata subsp. malaccensis TaxID=214687 RepID=A0A804I0F7_MUSAM